ncbi:MAG: Mg/Co/Ni transporter MgtE [Acidobacteriaceae bacterium]|nr:Mg/Co/Ni transporter MgtE [Acidobacteriaceae bacterium]
MIDNISTLAHSQNMGTIALTELLGAPVMDSSGVQGGRVREIALTPADDLVHISTLIVRTKQGDRLLPLSAVSNLNGGIRASSAASNWVAVEGEGLFLLERDLLDQQIIDVHGRKVVRVNDVDLYCETSNGRIRLKVASVDVGVRGAIRRLLKGIVPMAALNVLLQKIPPRLIPWEFVDLIETDPARRVKLKISHERLAKLHPADIADIVESLTPGEREAVFETLDEGVAAGALEEVQPKVKKSILESLDSERAADIVEEMNPDAAADLLATLPEERSSQILRDMAPQERDEVAELLEFRENTAAGRMNTEYLALDSKATVNDAIETLRKFEGAVESVHTIFLVDDEGKLVGAVPLAKLVLAKAEDKLSSLVVEPLISVHAGAREKQVTELFDKYNLVILPVLDDRGVLTGVITSDDVISLLRAKL